MQPDGKAVSMFVVMPLETRTNASFRHTPYANGVLIAVTVACFALLRAEPLAVGAGSNPFTVVLYAFAHSNLAHLLGNLWVLWVFGNAVNARLGNAYYAALYLGVASALGMVAWFWSQTPLIGASGAVFGVIAAFLILMPSSIVRVGYAVVFPLTVLIALFRRPKQWLSWFVEWGAFQLRGVWCLALVPILELWGACWSGTFGSNAAHLLGFAFGLAAVALLPDEVVFPRKRFATA
jgi:membrane associated rhomboid family serine protease